MSVFGGGGGSLTAATLRVPVVLDLDAFRAGLEKAKKEGATAGKEMGGDGAAGGAGGKGGPEKAKQEREKKIDYLAKVVFLAKTAWEITKKSLARVSEAVHRLAEYRGAGDPATSSFLRLEASATKAFDSFVLGALKSQAVQGALGALADAAKNAAEWAKGLGERIDRWAKDNAAGVAYFLGIVRGMGEYFVRVPRLIYESMRVVAGGIAVIAGKVIEFLAGLGESLGSVLDWVGFDRAAKSVRRMSAEWETFGATMADIGSAEVTKGVDALGEGLYEIGEAALKAEARVAKLLGELDPSKANRNDPLLSEQQQAVFDGMKSLASQVGDTWHAATEHIGKLFDDLAKKAIFGDVEQKFFMGLSRMLAGFSALGAQAEAAFGRSSRAAAIFARVQMATQGLVALVQGTMEVGEAHKAGIENPAAAVQHGAAAAAFFSAAGLAGARAAGLIGTPGRGGSGGGRDTALDSRASLADSVERTPVVVLLHIEGNVLGSEEYIKNSLMPRMQNLILEKNVTFAASDLVNGGRV